jgi:serine/threonine protein kinase
MDAQTTENVRIELRRAVHLLHDHGLVFGDLRPPNVMITKAHRVKLIDFNWAGEKGQARYPVVGSISFDCVREVVVVEEWCESVRVTVSIRDVV